MDEWIGHPLLARLYSYWAAKRGDGPAPLRRDIDPTELAFCLDHVALAEIETPFRVRYRLVGTDLVRLFGCDPTGRYIDELHAPRYRRNALAVYRQVADSGAPHYSAPTFRFGRFSLGYHCLILPLSWFGFRIDLIMAGIYAGDPRLRAAEQARDKPEVQAWLVDAGAPDRSG